MLAKRIILQFLLRDGRLVKGTRFSDHVDVGDPVSQAMIYDAQGAEEIVIVDIDATRQGRLIDTSVITRMINTCRLPIGAGGGIRTLDDARRCFGAGADKIVVNSAPAADLGFIDRLAAEFGSQSVVVSLDCRRAGPGWEILTHSGANRTALRLEEHLPALVEHGAGEVILTSVDREGTLDGFDLDLYRLARPLCSVPLVASGGAGSYDHIVGLFREVDCDACAIGKMLFLRDYDVVRIKSYLTGRKIPVRDA